MVTTSTAEEIREWAKQKRKYEAERSLRTRTNTNPYHVAGNAFAQAAVTASSSPSSSPAPTLITPDRPVKPQGIRKDQTASPRTRDKYASNVNLPDTHGRKSSENAGLRNKISHLHIDRDNIETDIFDILAEDSPSNKKAIQPPKTPVDSQKGIPLASDFDSRKTGLRKVSAIFKSKPTIDKNASDLSQVEPPNFDGSNWYRPDLVSLSPFLTKTKPNVDRNSFSVAP